MKEDDTKEIIEKVLKSDPQDIAFEPIPEENSSPLAQPVVEKNNSSDNTNASQNNEKQNTTGNSKEQATNQVKEEPLDAPEQEINDDPSDEKTSSENADETEFSMPIPEATLMANTILGVINNTILEVGAGYFVTIRKHKDFYDFDEVIHVIDQQNVKNIKRMKLDEEDKALIRPLLIKIIRRKSKVVSPEAQLLIALLSILMKKGKAMMEIREENEILVERIRDIIHKAINDSEENEEEEEDLQHNADKTSENKENAEEVYYEETQHATKVNNTGLPSSVLETSD